jgi:uncharacterized repeat protein (TIGR01451 family)
MFFNEWRSWLKCASTFPWRERRGDRGKPPRNRPKVESLEDRFAPAANITIIPGTYGFGTLDHFLSPTNGTITVADDPGDASATLSTGALGNVGPTIPISIAADNDITFNNFGGSLNLQTATGVTASFSVTSGSIHFNNTSNTLLTNGGSLVFAASTDISLAGLATRGGDITLTADNVDIPQPLNAGSGIITMQPLTNSLIVNVGNASIPGLSFGVTDAELDELTARVVRIGNSSNLGEMVIGDTITRHAGFDTLDLITGSDVNENAPLSVASLAIQAGSDISMSNALNDVDTFAATDSGSGSPISYTDANGFAVGIVDGVSGIHATGSGAVITLDSGPSFSASAPVTQDEGAAITGDQLLLLDEGPFTLNDPGNDVNFLAARVINAVSYTDANDLNVASVNGFNGIFTAGADITLTASAEVSDTLLTIDQPILSGSEPTIILTADRMILNASVDSNFGLVILQPTTPGRGIDLGTNPSPGKLGLAQSDLNNVGADTVRIGNRATSGDIAVTAPISDFSTIWNTLSLNTSIGFGISQNPGATLTVANLQASGETGVALDESNSVFALAGSSDGGFSFTDVSTLFVDTVDPMPGGIGVGILTGGPVRLTVAIGGALTVNQRIDTTFLDLFGGADVTLIADDMTINAPVNAPGAVVTLQPFTGTDTISLGGADGNSSFSLTLELDDDDLSHLMARVVRIGSSDQSGPISIDGPITRHLGFDTLDLNATGSGGSIVENGGSIDVANLALQADSGIGNGGAITVVGPITVAFENLSSNDVQVSSTGPMTIAPVDTLDGSFDSPVGNLASGANVSLMAASPITFAIDTSSNGSYSATTTETATENVTPLPPPDDDITVNSGVTVQSVNGDVTFTAGDSITLQAGSTVQANTATGTASLTAGSGDVDNDAVLTLHGTINGFNIFLTAPSDICIGVLNAGGTVSVTSTNAGILDCNDPPTSTNNITADTVIFSAATGIGSVPQPGDLNAADAPLEITAANLSFVNGASGNVQVVNLSGDLAVTGSNNAPGGIIILTVQNGNMLTVTTHKITSNNGDITLTADTMTFAGAVNAGSAIVTLTPFTAGRGIDLGTNPSAGKLGLAETDLTFVTASLLRVGSFTAGNVVVTSAITSPGSWQSLDVRSGGSITVNHTGAIDLGVVGPGSITLEAAGAVSLNAGAVVESTNSRAGSGGPITLLSNVGQPFGTASIGLAAGAQVLTSSNIVVNADPDGNSIGGAITLVAVSVLAGPGGGSANTITLTAARDITLSDLHAGIRVTATSTAGNLRDDGSDASAVHAPTILLTAALAIGGDTPLTANDVLTQDAVFAQALDLDPQGGSVSTLETGAGGNTQLRFAGLLGSFNINSVGANRQDALIFTVQNAFGAFAEDAVGNRSFLLAAINGNSIGSSVSAHVNGATATTVVVSVGGTILGAAPTGSARFTGAFINLVTTGGTIGTDATHPLEIDARTRLDAGSSGGNMFITDTAGGLTLGQINAGGGSSTIVSAANLTVPTGSIVQGGGAVNLTGGANNAGALITLNGRATGSPVTFFGGAGNDTFSVNPSGGSSVMTFNGAAGNDSFSVTPNAGISFTINGGAPITFPGDVLNVNTTGVTGLALNLTPPVVPPSLNGSYTFSNRATINFTSIEMLLPGVDLAVTKVASPLHAFEGRNLTYTIGVTNKGVLTSTGVTLTDVLPAGMAFVSTSANFSGYNPKTGILNLGTLASGVTITGTIVVHPLAEGPITNTATVASTSTDTNPADNTASVTTQVVDNPGILLLEPVDRNVINLSGTGTIAVTGGDILVNSTNPAAVIDTSSGSISAGELDVGASTGILQTGTGMLPTVIRHNEPPTADPLADLPQPTSFRQPTNSGAVFPGGTYTSGRVVLQPGTYTGAIKVSGTAMVTLLPGIYYLLGGFSVSGPGASVTGSGVLLYLNPPFRQTGGLDVIAGARMMLTPLTSGPYQGITIWQDRNNGVPIIVNGGLLNVTGTVYAPDAQVNVSNGGVLQMQGNASLGIAAHLIALDIVVASGTINVDASANPLGLP